jgi:5,10-methylenetetrahydromethanopterin reductase
MARPEVWTTGVGFPGLADQQAERAEAAGFDGIQFVDSQNLAGDSYVTLALAARATDKLKLATGVTNPVTRHPAVTAGAIAAVQAVSGGRAQLGIGRGDSALAHLGRAPAPVAVFERYVEQLQAYLRGDEVAFDAAGAALTDAPSDVSALGLAHAPTVSRLEWVKLAGPKVPVAVVGTGPRVLAVGGRLAERVTLAVGADPDRLQWAIDTVRATARDADAGPLSIGAYVNVVAHDDPDTARQLGSGGLATFARFSVMHGRPAGPVSAEQDDVLRRVHGSYDMTQHTRAGAPQTEALTPEFAERFAVLGPSAACASRLRDIASLGLDHLVIVGPSLGADRTEATAARRRFAEEVLPAL